MVYFVNICEGTAIRKIVTNILNSPALDRLRNWPNFKVLFLQRKAMLLQELFWPAGEKRKKKIEVWQYQRNRTLPKLDVWPNVILAGFIYHLVHHLGSVTKTNKPALGRVGRIRVEKHELNWKSKLFNDQSKWSKWDSSRPVCFNFWKVFY